MRPLEKGFLNDLPPPYLTLGELQQTWLYGGYPEPIFNPNPHFFLQWMENYEKTYLYRDIGQLFPKLNKIVFQRFLSMLCKLSSTILNKSDLARALEVSEGSIRQFLSIAEGTFIWRQLPSYEKSVHRSIVKMPKGYIRDSGLLHALLKVTDLQTLYQDPVVGHSFEGFIIEEILKGLESLMLTHWSPYYYRTRSGVEIDLIIEGPFGTLPIEIKYGSSPHPRQWKAIDAFVEDNQLNFGLLINQASEARWLSPRVFQLPVNYL